MFYSFKFPHDKMNVNNIETQKSVLKFSFLHTSICSTKVKNSKFKKFDFSSHL